MSKLIEAFKDSYWSLLRYYLNRPTESLRQQAYQLAQRAVAEESSIIDIIQTHHEALAMMLTTDAFMNVDHYNTANELLREVLVPFEIIFRGYREVNHQLTELNDQLVAKTNELKMMNKELEAFSYSVSHDLRAPLRSMIRFSH